MKKELTKEEINEFLARREDINRLMQGPFDAFEVEKAERRARYDNDYDFEADYNWDPKYGSPCLTIIDFDRCSCEEGKNDVIEITIIPKNSEISISEEFEKNIMDFRNYLFTDRLNNIHIYYTFDEASGKPRKRHQYRTIQKKIIKDNILEVLIVDEKKKWDKNLHDKKLYARLESTYRFYQYSGECTEENEYEGKAVTILFPDDETSQRTLMKNSPAIFRTVPLKNTVVKPDNKDSVFFDSDKELPLYYPLFFTNAPSIKIDSNGNNPKIGEIAKIRSGIFAAFEAFAKDNPNIVYKYIPMDEFLTLYANLVRRKTDQEIKVLNGGIFFKKCHIIPTDKGFISLEELLEKTKIDSNAPEYKIKYPDRKTLGAVLANLKDTLDKNDHFDEDDLKKKIGKLLLWDKYGDAAQNLCIHQVNNVEKSVGNYHIYYEIKDVLLEEYVRNSAKRYVEITPDMFSHICDDDRIKEMLLEEHIRNLEKRYVEITADMFSHVRSALFENLDEPVDEFVRTALKEKRIAPDRLFDELRERPWHKSFLTPGDDSSTILDDYIEELSALSFHKDDNGKICTESFMNFDNVDGFTKLPSKLYNECQKCFGEDVFFDEEIIYDMTVSDIMETAKYYAYEGNKTAYFWSGDREYGHLVIFGKKAFHKILDLIVHE